MVLTLIGITIGCSKKSYSVRSPKSVVQLNPLDGIYYSLFVRSFADSNGDGIGDFNGITENLDYLSDLGISGLWLLPIYPSHSYHGYDVDDYYNVNQEYGTMADFERLLAGCAEHGICVMLDITFNHSSSNNQWFIDSKNPADPHRSWYHWISENEGYSLNTQVWGHRLWNKVGNGYYAGEFQDGMPDFNLDSPELRAELKNVLAFWLDKGVSGFRFDAAGHIYDKIKMPAGFDRSTEASADFWKDIISFIKSKKSDSFNVAEVWDTTSIRAQALAGLDSVFHFDIGDNYILNMIKNKSAGNNNLAHIFENDFAAYRKYNPDFIDAPFLTNHDQARIAGNLKGSLPELKLAAGMYLLTQGIPFVYYGEELGMMSGTKDETKRTPFLWTAMDSKKLPAKQTSWAAAADCIYNKKTLGLEQQTKDKNSLYNYYKRLINFRNECPAFGQNSVFASWDSGNEAIASWVMTNTTAGARALVLHNVSDKEVSLQLPEEFTAAGQPAFSTNPVKAKDGTITIPPLTTVVYTK